MRVLVLLCAFVIAGCSEAPTVTIVTKPAPKNKFPKPGDSPPAESDPDKADK